MHYNSFVYAFLRLGSYCLRVVDLHLFVVYQMNIYAK